MSAFEPIPFTALVDAPEDDSGSAKLESLADHWQDGLLDKALDPNRTLVRLEDAGMGSWLDRVLGGGLEPGNIVAVGAAGAGAGKTAFIHQVADGLAMASAKAIQGAAGAGGARPSVVPVIFVTEMSSRDLTLRQLSRLSERPGYLLRAPRASAGLVLVDGESAADEALRMARAAAECFKPAAELIYTLDRTSGLLSGGNVVGKLTKHVRWVREYWERRANVTAVLLVIDPVHRLLDPTLEEKNAIAQIMAEVLDLTHKEGLITFYTSDTTKAAVGTRSSGDDANAETLAEQAFRGSYNLVHVPDFVFLVRTVDPKNTSGGGNAGAGHAARFYNRPGFRDGMPGSWSTLPAEILIPKSRWWSPGERPAYWYDRALYRFVPMPQP